MAAHFPQRDAKVGVTPAPADRVLRHSARIRMPHLIVGRVDQPIRRRCEAEIFSNVTHRSPSVKLVVDVGTFDRDHVAHACITQKACELIERFWIADDRRILVAVAEHKRRLDRNRHLSESLADA